MIYKVFLRESECRHVILIHRLTFPLRFSARRYHEGRTWRQRLTRSRQSWEPVLPSLTKLYMQWKYASLTRPASPMTLDIPSAPVATSNTTPLPNNFDFTLETLDIYTLDKAVMISCSGEEMPIQALMRSGYLGNTPATPTLAISLRTLELFRRMRLRKSSFSMEAFAKLVCDLYSVRHFSMLSV